MEIGCAGEKDLSSRSEDWSALFRSMVVEAVETEVEKADVLSIVNEAPDIQTKIRNVWHQTVPPKYQILRLCAAVRGNLPDLLALLDRLEEKYGPKRDMPE